MADEQDVRMAFKELKNLRIRCEFDDTGATEFRTVMDILYEAQANYKTTDAAIEYRGMQYHTPFKPCNGSYNGYVTIPDTVSDDYVNRWTNPHGGFTGGYSNSWGFDCGHMGVDDTVIHRPCFKTPHRLEFSSNDENHTFKTQSYVATQCRRIIDICCEFPREAEVLSAVQRLFRENQ